MKPVLWIIAIVCLVSCNGLVGGSTPDDLVRASAEKLLKSKMGDPESYEFVSLVLVDSITFAHNIEAERDGHEFFLNRGIGDKERDQRMITDINAIEKSMGAQVKNAAAYNYLFTFRSKNAFGAKVINTYFVQTKSAPTYEVVNMTMDRDKLYRALNGFPGYEELKKKYDE